MGHSPGELVRSGVHGDAFYRDMWATILSGKVWRGELVNQRRDGSRYDEAMAIAPVFGARGAIQNFVAIKQDITERKAAERQLHQSEQRLELALAGSGLGMWDWNIASSDWEVSPRWAAIVGHAPEGLMPHIETWKSLLHPLDAPAVYLALDTHLRGESAAYVCEYRLRHKDGHWVWVLDRGRVVFRGEDGQPLRAAGTLQDISDHKRLNLEGSDLLRRIESLIREVAQPTATPPAGKIEASAHQPRITRRQHQILTLVVQGHSSPRIAQQLRISEATVQTHRRDLMAKLGVHSTAELTRLAIAHGWVQQ